MFGINMINSILPMVKPHIPKVEQAIHERLTQVELNAESGEKYAGFVVVRSAPTGAKILLAAFDVNDRVIRIINKQSVTDFLTNLLNSAK